MEDQRVEIMEEVQRVEGAAVEDDILHIPECEESLKPRIGMRFDTTEDGVKFYKAYAKACGFSARKSTLKVAEDDTEKIRYVLCTREGKKYSPPSIATRKRRRPTCRIGCKARVAFKFHSSLGFVLYKFIEGRNHEMIAGGYHKYMKENRNLDYSQQLFLAKCAKATVGAAKCYRIYKQFAGDVGATKTDFKNMARDIKGYAVGIDSELLLEKFGQLRAKDERFSFSFERDNNSNLIRLFWADAVAVQNYQIFGDAVSFDATYRTNKYCMIFAPFTGQDNHGRCVNFGAGLLAHEDTESYSWLLTKFVECMGSAPKMLITDQDLGMRSAIDKVLPNTRHRFCMWHITKKLVEKLPVSLRDTDFVTRFNDIVLPDAEEPSVFESNWISLISDFSLGGNKWFTDMFALRSFWVPAFFRDTAMSGLFRTTSLSECENSFFRRYLNKNSNLSDMYMLFEIAIEAQREDHDLVSLADQSTVPDRITRLEIERHASTIYTNSKFLEVQKEIEMSITLCLVGTPSTDANHVIYDVDEDAVGLFKVTFNPDDDFISCQCSHFIWNGLICRHMFAVFKVRGYKSIPDKYVVQRWTKKACSVFDEVGQNYFSLGSKEHKDPNKGLFALACKSIAIADGDDKLSQELAKVLENFTQSHAPVDASMTLAKRKQKVIERYYGSKVPSIVSTGDPNMSKMKGSCSRLKSRIEAAVEKAKKPERMCRKCRRKGHHDSRNCPNVLSEESD